MKKILIVDDSETVRSQVSDALESAGFTVTPAKNGTEGLAQAQAASFAMILLDVNMPGLSGLEVLDHLHAAGTTAQTPVLMLTTEAHETMVARAKNAGAKGWVIKPVRMELLVSAVRRLTT
ncbi:MAG TPA: response regulator [Polyangiaceae bacterium]|nr:response regulator [Polyangiaceae bacterium]